MIKKTLLTLLLSFPAFAADTQAERCAPNKSAGEMMCVLRNGHCAELAIDGQKTAALTDEETGRRVHAVEHGETVCWRIARPVSTRFRASASAGGIFPSFVGKIERLQVNIYPLDSAAAKRGESVEALEDITMTPDGDPGGTWQVKPERPLKAGEYVLVFRIFGKGNWDRQAVLVKLDPSVAPGPAEKTGTSR